MPVSRVWIRRFTLLGLAALPLLSSAQSLDPKLYSEMHWRSIGPRAPDAPARLPECPASPTFSTSASTTAACGAPPTTAPPGRPSFDNESTGSIGAIAVAPSDPNTIYVGTGAGIIRPDLATGDGMYKSTDAEKPGRTWACAIRR